MDLDNEIEAKQSFLQNQIIEKGYDTSDFLSFLTEIKGDEGTDINNLSMSELKNVKML